MRITVTIGVFLLGLCLANAQTNCSTVLCRWGRCVVTNGRATCQCPDACPANHAPVCGSDGHTYSNACLLGIQACRTQGGVTQISEGECPAAPTSCAAVTCPVGSTCEVVNGVARCKCPTGCTKERQPVCGSDNVTYNNKCLLNKKSCETGGSIYEIYSGPCSTNPCNTARCGWGATCKVESGRAVCDCDRACAEIFQPVCGSDGTTYGNECELGAATCHSQGVITKAHDGECEQRPPLDCSSVLCAPNTTCEIVNGGPTCIPISASCQVVKCNATTHCEIVNGRARCVPNGSSGSGRQVGEWCGGTGIWAPQCADGLVCTPDPTSPVHAGICEEDCALVDCRSGRLCKIQDHRAVCVCPTICTREYDPRCGSDGRTYGNGCEMNIAVCNSDGRIYEVRRGACRAEQACTVANWKNNQPQWNLAKSTRYYTIFGYYVNGDNLTLKEVILTTATSDYAKLTRQSVAAYLNAAKGLNYRYSREEVVSKTKEAFRTNSYSSALSELTEANTVGNCPFA